MGLLEDPSAILMEIWKNQIPNFAHVYYTPVNEDIGQKQLFGPKCHKVKSSNSLLMSLVDTNFAQK